MKAPVIAAGPVVLRPPEAADAEQFRDLCRDPEIQRWITFARPLAEDGYRDGVAGWVARSTDASDRTQLLWLLTDAANPRVVLGQLIAMHLDLAHLVPGERPGKAGGELGYFLGPAFRGRGIVGAALHAACSWMREDLRLHRLQLWHAVDNTASCAVATRAGFVHEGTARESYRYGDGCLYDEHLHGLLLADLTDRAANS